MKKRQTFKNHDSRGFTIVELLIVIITGTAMLALVFEFFWNYWQYAEKAQSDSDLLVSRLDIGDYVREMVGTSSGLIVQNSIPDSNTNVVDPVAGSNYWAPIHPVPTTTPVSSSSDQPVLYFKRFSQNSSKNFIMNGINPYEDEFIIYLSTNGQIRVRVLANTSASGNILTTTCPPAVATAACPADKTLIENVVSIDSRFFSRSGNLIDYTPVFDPVLGANVYGPDYPSVEVLEYTINIARAAFTQTTNTTQSSTIIRIALRNT